MDDKGISPQIQSPSNQTVLANLCLLNKQWNRVAITRLYAHPRLNCKNYDLFVRSVIFEPTHRDLTEFIKELDLRLLLCQSSKSVMARLIGRTKNNLEIFRAAPKVFGVNCLAALSNCTKLHVLDLSVVTSPVNYWDFVRTLERLPQLKSLDAPRIIGAHYGIGYYPAMVSTEFPWPPTLSRLRLSRFYQSNDLDWIVLCRQPNLALPNTLTMLVIQKGQFRRHVLTQILENVGHQLRDLTLTNLINIGMLNNILYYVENLERLCISTNLIDSTFPIGDIQSDHFERIRHHPLRRLEIATCSGTTEIQPNQSHFSILSLAYRLDTGVLTNLRRVDVWKTAVPRFQFTEWVWKWMHNRLLALGSEEADGYENAGLYTVDDSDWDGMVTLN